MALPKLDDHDQVIAAKNAVAAANQRREAAEQALRDLESRMIEIEEKKAHGQVTTEELEELRALRPQIEPAREERDIAGHAYVETTSALDEARRTARRELRQSRAVAKLAASKHRALVKAGRAFVQAQQEAVDLLREGKEADIWQYFGEFGDAPKIAVSLPHYEPTTLLNALAARVEQLESSKP